MPLISATMTGDADTRVAAETSHQASSGPTSLAVGDRHFVHDRAVFPSPPVAVEPGEIPPHMKLALVRRQ